VYGTTLRSFGLLDPKDFNSFDSDQVLMQIIPETRLGRIFLDEIVQKVALNDK
jgi:hypothetical protein